MLRRKNAQLSPDVLLVRHCRPLHIHSPLTLHVIGIIDKNSSAVKIVIKLDGLTTHCNISSVVCCHLASNNELALLI